MQAHQKKSRACRFDRKIMTVRTILLTVAEHIAVLETSILEAI